MQEARRHRLSRGARLALFAGGIGIAWAGAVVLLGGASDAHADDGLIPDVAGAATEAVADVAETASDIVPVAEVVDTVADLPVVEHLPAPADLPVVGEVIEAAPPVVAAPAVEPPVAAPAAVASTTIAVTVDTPRALGVVARTAPVSVPAPADANTVPPASVVTSAVFAAPAAPLEGPPAPSQTAVSAASAPTSAPADRTSSPSASFALDRVDVPHDDSLPPGIARVIDSSPD